VGSAIIAFGPLAGEASAQTQSAAEAQSSEIVVTAQKREEKLQNVPISVAVLDGRQLDADTGRGITDALRRVPGVAVTEGGQGGGTVLTVRGVASSYPIMYGSSSIAYYVDSIPFALVRSAILPDPAAYDLDRVEVLRGPQGTLYGASGVGGVVRILTKDANLQDFEFKMRASVATTKNGSESYRGDAAVNIPIVDDKLAVRVVAGYNNVGGYIDSPLKKDMDSARLGDIRIKVNAQPTERTDVAFFSWFQRNHYDKLSTSDSSYTTSSKLDQPASSDFDAYGLTIRHEFDGFEVKSSTSYIKFTNNSLADLSSIGSALDGATLVTNFGSKIFSEELLLNSIAEGPWEWSVGAFYRDGKDSIFQALTFPGGAPNPLQKVVDTSASYAIFGEASRKFLDDKLKLTVGLRYFHDSATTQGHVTDFAKYTIKSKAWTPRAVLAWTPDKDHTVYASYSQGFRSGLNQNELVTTTVPSFPPAKPDKLHNYEVGTKGSAFGNLIHYEAALYYIKWNGIQQLQIVQFPQGVRGAGVVNGTSASGWGAEILLFVRPTRGLEIGGSMSWNDLKQDADVFSGGIISRTKGSRLDLSPEYTASAFTTYSFPINDDLKATLSGSFNYTSRLSDCQCGSLRRDEAYTTGAARFAVSSNHWTITAYVENINNDRHVFSATGNVPDFWHRLRPRTLGLQVAYEL